MININLTNKKFLFMLAISAVWLLQQMVVPAAAAATTDAEEHTQLRDALFENLLKAQSEPEGRQAEDAIWKFWFDQAPDAKARELLDAGIERREAYDYESAENHFDELIDLAPEYSEGYNQRAFIRFLREKHADAQADLEKALTLEPDHFGALSGLYHIHVIQNRPKAGFEFLRQAVQIHPWLRERSALPQAMQSGQSTDQEI